MPTNACQFFYECTNCKTLLRPKPGDCCVFCSYGSVKCPPKQDENQTCCVGNAVSAENAGNAVSAGNEERFRPS
jgi:hypothetical protein